MGLAGIAVKTCVIAAKAGNLASAGGATGAGDECGLAPTGRAESLAGGGLAPAGRAGGWEQGIYQSANQSAGNPARNPARRGGNSPIG